MKKVIVALILCMLITSVPASASSTSKETEISTSEKESSRIHIYGAKYICINSIDGRLSFGKWGKAYVDATIDGGKDVKQAKVVAELQQYKNGEWIKVKSWESYNQYDGYVLLNKTYYVAKGYDYQVVLDIWVYDKNGKVLDSTTVTIPKQHY